MKFDFIIGNPPYQESDGGAQASARPIYQFFMQSVKPLSSVCVSLIMPARWYAGGKGLDEFRDEMLNDIHIKVLHDFPITSDCFPGVNIRGGVCILVWCRDYDNSLHLTKVVTHEGNKDFALMRSLKYEDLDIFIRYGQALEILEKVSAKCKNDVLMSAVSSRKPFGLTTDFTKTDSFHDNPKGMKRPVNCYGKGKKIGFVEYEDIPSHRDWIDCWKVFTSRANNIGTELNDDNLNAFVAGRNYICTESYISIGADLGLTEKSAKNLTLYLQTKFVRFLHSLAKSSQDATAKTYRFIPMENFEKAWTDDELYRKYGLTDDEIAFIESHVKEMV